MKSIPDNDLNHAPSTPIHIQTTLKHQILTSNIRSTITQHASEETTILLQSDQTQNPPWVQVPIYPYRVKKHQNKQFDKLVSLITYTITSSDKAMRYLNLSVNFEAEFAYKLYLSDRENLLNDLNSLVRLELDCRVWMICWPRKCLCLCHKVSRLTASKMSINPNCDNKTKRYANNWSFSRTN